MDDIKVYTIVFIQSEDQLRDIAKELNVESIFDLDDKTIIKYLMQWHHDDVLQYDCSIFSSEDLDTEFLGYRIDKRKKHDGYLLSSNYNLNYIGLSWFEKIKE